MAENERPYFPDETEHKEVLKSMGLLDFVWDDAKNQHNIKIHHIDFETAMLVFNDDDRIEIYDESHSDYEDRYDVIGHPMADMAKEALEPIGTGSKLTLGRVHGLLFVVYTDRIIMGRERIRLISARLATKFEEMLYLNHTL